MLHWVIAAIRNSSLLDIQLDALPSPEQMWVSTLAAAKRIDSELECARNGGNLDEENSREKCLARAWDVFNALPEAVRKLYGNPSAMRSLLASRDTSVSEMNRIYRPAFMQAIKKAPAKALQTPKTAPQLTQGTQPAAQISDSSKSA